MASKQRKSNSEHPLLIRLAGRDWPVLERMIVGRRNYLVLKKTAASGRTRYMAFDSGAAPGGDLRSLLMLPQTRASRQHVRVLKRLSSNNVNLPTILEYQKHANQLVLVLTWVRGPDLESYLNEVRNGHKPRPSATESFRLFRGLAHGLSQLHRRHTIVHGDIKPANLILASSPSRLVMIDFGSAWLAERTTHREQGDGCTWVYAAPELQAAKSTPDFRSDQFSATVVLYEMLTLERPYDDLGGQAGRPEFVDRMNNTLQAPSKLRPDSATLPQAVWAGIDRIVAKGLALDPRMRYLTCDAWLDDVNAVYARIQLRSELSPFNERMTRVANWVINRLRRR